MELEGRVVVVTGAASGIGRALAQRFVAEGATLVLADRDAGALTTAADAIGALAVPTDVADRSAVTTLIDTAEVEAGPIDLFFANAGIFLLGGVEVAPDEWQRIWDINVMAHVHAAAVLVPRWLERGGGYFCATASAAGLLSQIGSAPYSVTKHAAVAFAEWLSITYGERGLKVSVLCPQAVNTPMAAVVDGGGVAGVDGMIEPTDVAEVVVQGIREERLHLLPHPEVAEYMRRRGEDPERWIAGMRRLQRRFPTP